MVIVLSITERSIESEKEELLKEKEYLDFFKKELDEYNSLQKDDK